MADDRPGRQRPHRGDRPQFGGDRPQFGGDRPQFGGDRPQFSGPRPPFRPAQFEPAQATHTLRLRDGDREIEVSGSAPFVRQVLDDLPALLAKLRSDASPRPAAIRMPSATENPPLEVVGSPVEAALPPAESNGSMEDRILAIL